jgi:ribosome maturation factor RimP
MEVFMKIEDKIRELIEEEINKNNYILDEVVYVKEGGVQFLRIIIDKEGYINVDDCLKVYHAINPILDKNDPIKEQYMLDVCSKEKGRE